MSKKYQFRDVLLAAKTYDSWWTVVIIDPFAFRLTLFVANNTKLTPNHITFLSIFFGIFSSIFFLQATYDYLLLGAVFFQMSFLLDCVDGKLARLTGRETVFGKYLEFFRDKSVHMLNLAALTLGQFVTTKSFGIVKIGLIYFMLLFTYWLLYKSPFLKGKFLGKNYSFSGIYSHPTSVEVMSLVFFIGPLMNNIALGLGLGSLILFLLICYRLYKIYHYFGGNHR